MNKIEEKVEQRLQEAQSNKEFKDVGRVSNLKKTKSAYRLIDMSNLSEIEMDEVQAFNIIKKELVWQPIDVTEEKDKGTTSGATFLKLEIRKAVPNKPDNSKEKRASYVMFLNKLQADLSECFNVKQIENLGNNYRKLPISDIISYLIDPTYSGKSLEDKNKVDEHIKKNYKLSMMYGAERLMLQLIEEIFSKRFSNILFCKGDTAYETYKEAKDKEPITDEQSIVLIANLRDSKEKFIQANINNQNQYKNFSEAELKSAMNTNWQLNSISKTAYKEDIEKFRTWVIDYYERKIKRGEIEYEAKIELSKPKDNDWSWSEDKKEKSERKSIDNKLIINKKEPLAYIKRTGGYKIGDISVNELIDKFGYKAVNYGNYVDDKWSKQHTKFYLQAMSDLGEIFNINIKELNELGGLNIVFGGKGHKGHAATYYPQTKDINLTKNNGDGSVGHEYGHYFDNLMVDLDKKKAEPLLATENLNSIQDYEVRMAFKNIVDFFQKGNPLYTPKMKVKFFAQENNTIPTIPYLKDRRWEYKKLELKPTIEETFEQCEEILVFDENLYQTQVRVIGYIINHFGLSEYSIEIRLKTSMFYQKSKYNLFNYCYKVPSKYNPNRLEIKKAGDYRTPYWTSNVEMFARAWETILFKKILEKNRRSDYLVSGIDMTDLNVEGFQNPYPSGSELEYLETLFDKLIIEVKKAFNLSDFIAYNTDREDMLVEFESKTKSEIKVGIDVTKGKEEEVVEYIEENNVVETITENILEPQTEMKENASNNLTIKYKGLIPYNASSYSQKFNQKATLLRDYHDDTVVNENGRTNFKEPKYYSYGYLKTGTTLGTKRGWVLNLPQKGMSMEMEYHPQKFEDVNDLYWVFEGRIFPFPEDATIQTKKITEKFREEHNLGNLIYGYGKKDYITFDGNNAAVDMQYDSSIEKSKKYYAIYFGDEKNGLFEKGLITHSLPNAYLYAKQFDVQQATLLIIENKKVSEEDVIYPYSESTDLQEIAKDWFIEYYGDKKQNINKEDKEIVLNEGNGIAINKLFNEWDNIKNEKESSEWKDKVKNTKFGTYGTIGLVETINKFNPKLNEVIKRNFYNDIESALDIPRNERTYKPYDIEKPYISEQSTVDSDTIDDEEDVLKDLQKYSSPNKYNSEIEVGQRYYDNRYQDYYTIEKMTEIISGGDVNATLKYDKGATKTESGDFILYHIDNKQHSLSKEETKDSDAIINNIENDDINKQTIQTQNKTETMQTEKKQNDWINKVPSSEKYSKKVKSTAYKLDPTDKNLLKIVEPFASKDELRPEMSAILFDENGITCTNAHILIHLEAKNLQYEGLFIGDKNKKLFGDVKADQLNVSAYPKWKNIIRENVEDENLYDVDVLAIKTYCEIVERLKFSNQTIRAIKFSYGNDNEKLISFNYGFMLTLCESLLLLGYEKCKMVVGRNNQYALFVMNENFNLSMNPANESFALIMPIMITNLEDYGNYDIDMDRGAEFVYSLTNDAIYSNKEYFHKINTNITKAEASNSSSLDVKEVAKIKSKIKKANYSIPILDYCKIENGVLTINDLESIYETKASGYEDGIYEILGESLRKVPNTPLDDYPRTPKNVNIKLAEINRQELVYILDLADNFVSTDDLRPIMTGVSLSYKEGQMVIASTDANKLLRYELSSFHAEKDFSLVLPVNYFDFLRFFDCDNITIYSSENSDEKVLFDCDSRRIYFRNIDGRYPAIDSVIPSETNNQIVISKKILSEMLATKTPKDKEYQIEHNFYEDGTIKTFNVKRSSYNYNDTESDEKTLVAEYKVDSIRLSDESTTLNKSHIFLAMPVMVKHEEGETVSLISFRNDILKSMSKLDQSIYEINFTASNRAGVVPIDVYSVAGIPKTPSQKIKEKESLSNKEIVLSISSMIINKLKQDSINIKTRVSKNGVFLYGEKLPNGKISHETYFSFEEIPNQEQINLAILEFKTYSKPKTEYKEEPISDDKRRVLEAIKTIEEIMGIVDGKDLIKLQKRKSSLEELIDIL